ncbi:MAG: hypothetical protein H7X85_11880 [Thermoanaerobaculia bacterium]|nr:hypothetical protein [Thermoanaerobaculia bacterium]
MLPRDSAILEALRQKGSRVLTFRQLAKKLGVREADEEALRESLEALERAGEIARIRGEQYSSIDL